MRNNLPETVTDDSLAGLRDLRAIMAYGLKSAFPQKDEHLEWSLYLLKDISKHKKNEGKALDWLNMIGAWLSRNDLKDMAYNPNGFLSE